MRNALAFVLFLSLGSVLAAAETPVKIPDPVLKAAIEEELGTPDPTPTDMLGLAELRCVQNWDMWSEGISDLTGLEYATNLRSLNLRLNQIGDLSALAGLTNLSSLDVSQNFVGDLSPLAGLYNLSYFNIHENCVGDLSPLQGLSELGTLILRGNQISDLWALATLVNLSELDLAANQISDISPLSGLSHLSTLSLFNNQISDISCLSGLKCLRILDLDTNLVTDISSLFDLTSLSQLDIQNNPLGPEVYSIQIPSLIAANSSIRVEHDGHAGRYLMVSSTLGGSVIDPGEGRFTHENNTFVRLTAKADPGFVFAGWLGKRQTTDNPVSIIVNEDCQMRACFLSLQDTLYVDDDALADPAPGDPDLGDPNADGSAEHPAERIQDAIDIAGKDAAIIVRPGTYRENINLMNKRIQLAAVDPCDPLAGPCAIIEGATPGPVVRISSGNKGACSLSGLVITKGWDNRAGAIYCTYARPTLNNCLIVGNYATEPGGGVLYFYDSRVTLINCTIADNRAGEESAGMVLEESDATVLNSIFWGNSPREISCDEESNPSICYCDVQGWWPDIGNLRSDPLFVCRGYWANPIATGSAAGFGGAADAWVAGDYHLKSQTGRWDAATRLWLSDQVSSPCIDAGDCACETGPEPAPNGGIVNLGAYGGTTEASQSH